MFKKLLLVFIFISVCCTTTSIYSLLFAEEDVFVSLIRKPQKKENLPTNVTVVDEQQIKKSGARTLGEALGNLPSTNIGTYGTLGAQKTLIMRGALDKQTLVLIDGMPVNDITMGGYDFSQLSTDNIERIEIIRGAASSIYGPNAMAGVVNVITKKPYTENLTRNISISAGSFNEQTVDANIGIKSENVETFITGSKHIAEGFMENSKYDNNNFTVYLGLKTSNLGNFKFNTGISNRSRGIPGKKETPIPVDQWNNVIEKKAENPDTTQTNLLNYMSIQHIKNLSDGLQLTSKLYGNNDNQNYNSPASTIATKVNKTIVGAGTQIEVNDLTLGIEVQRDTGKRTNELTKSTDFDESIRWTSLYGQKIFLPKDTLNVILGLRYDNHSLFGGETSPQLTAVWRPEDTWKLSSNIGHGYRAPTFEDLLSPKEVSTWGETQGNPDLKPETSWSYDLGIERQINKNILSQIILFRQDVENLIEWDNVSTDPNWGQWRPSNVSQAYHQGIEFVFSHKVHRAVSYDMNYTYLESKGKSSISTNYETLMYRPAHTVNYNISYNALSGISSILSYKFVGEQFDENDDKINSYNLFNFRVEQKFLTYSKIFASIENILDTRYFTRLGYALPGRTFHTGINIVF